MASTGVVTLERETLHVMDGVRRIALVETMTVDADAGGAFQVTTVMRLQMGSAALEVDESGMVISYEEYHPYGTTAYQSATSAVEVSRKRYRYTGKERDEETGLYYHGARYYAPWLGRWTAADPAGLVDGTNLYEYVKGNPIRMHDPSGHAGEDGPDYGMELFQRISVDNAVKLGTSVPTPEYQKSQLASVKAEARARKASDVEPQAIQATPSQPQDGLLAAVSHAFKKIDDYLDLCNALDEGDSGDPIVKEQHYSQGTLEYIKKQTTFNHAMDTWAVIGLASEEYAAAWGLSELYEARAVLRGAEKGEAALGVAERMVVDPVLDSSVFVPILEGDPEAVAFANANRGLLAVDRIAVREALTSHSRTTVRDALRTYDIRRLGGTLAEGD